MKVVRAAFALMAPLVLWGCLLTPGKFVSTMTVNADRSFAFTYKGEVIDAEPDTSALGMTSDNATDAPKAKQPSEDLETRRRAVAEALAKEAGYRSVAYVGKGKFMIDYAIKGTLDHAFLFPFNADAQAIMPFVMVEVRQGGTVRIRAPGFAQSPSAGPLSGSGVPGGAQDGSKYLDGMFTLDTDAEIVSQSNEDGVRTVGGRKVVSWRATPLSKDAPTAVLRLRP
jgi:hypothetical protein